MSVLAPVELSSAASRGRCPMILTEVLSVGWDWSSANPSGRFSTVAGTGTERGWQFAPPRRLAVDSEHVLVRQPRHLDVDDACCKGE